MNGRVALFRGTFFLLRIQPLIVFEQAYIIYVTNYTELNKFIIFYTISPRSISLSSRLTLYRGVQRNRLVTEQYLIRQETILKNILCVFVVLSL